MVDAAKQAIRRRVWELMERAGVARFPRPVWDRIPNFVGSDEAANRATTLAAWRQAEVVKSNPDAPQLPLRRRALEEGKLLYMAVPRLREVKCFVRLDPRRISSVARAASISGASRLGESIHPKEMRRVDLVVAGSVAVNRKGARIGKGGGYSDLEFAIARAFGLVDETTPVLTTVHAFQILEDDLPMRTHDEPVDWIATPRDTTRTDRAFPKPRGLLWDLLSDDQIRETPILAELRHGPARSMSK